MAMWRSTDRILTTHGGNLPRPADLDNLIADWRDHQPEIEDMMAVAEVMREEYKAVTDAGLGLQVDEPATGRAHHGYLLPLGTAGSPRRSSPDRTSTS